MIRDKPTRGELLHNFVGLTWFTIRRVRTREDLPYVFLIFVAPLLHSLRFKGELRTPIGKLNIKRNDILRWSIYGLLKTRFSYMRMLETQFRSYSRATILDVGANLGDFSMAVSETARKIISIEPGPENFALLQSNLYINSLKHVLPLNIAAHDSFEELSLEGNGADLRVSEFNGGAHTKGMPLDAVLTLHEMDHVDLVKIDVQGHEIHVLHGMSDSLKRHRIGLAIVEVHGWRHVKVSDIVCFMQSYGYRLVATNQLFGRPQLYFECLRE